jgi:hypothetical protein
MGIKIKSNLGSVTIDAENLVGDQSLTIPSQASATLQTTSDAIASTRLTGALPVLDGSALTGVGVDGIVSTANATAITIDSNENVGIGVTPTTFYSGYTGVQIGANGTFYGQTSAGGSNNFWMSQNVRAGTDGSEKAITTGTSSQMMLANGEVVLKVAPSATADANVSWTTGLEVLNSGKARAKNGIMFGTDTSDSNALDDYEEGTWTPVFAGSSPGGTYTYLTRAGHYTKVGDLVTVMGYFCNLTASSAGGGNAMITGLPYAPRGMSNSYGPVGAVIATYCTISGTLMVWPTSSSVLYLIDVRSGQDRTHFSPGSISSGATDMGFTLTYHTDS